MSGYPLFLLCISGRGYPLSVIRRPQDRDDQALDASMPADLPRMALSARAVGARPEALPTPWAVSVAVPGPGCLPTTGEMSPSMADERRVHLDRLRAAALIALSTSAAGEAGGRPER
jgi:hypothetical protein